MLRNQRTRRRGGDNNTQGQEEGSQGHAKDHSDPKNIIPPPFYRGKKFELLSPSELNDTRSHCPYCSRKFCNPSSRIIHLIGQHHEEHYKNIIANQEGVKKAYEMGKPMNLSKMQQEAYIMGTLETTKVQAGTILERIHTNIMCNNQNMYITPTMFSMLFNMVKIRDGKFAAILKILTHGCQNLTLNPPGVVTKFFESERFFQLFMNTNMIIDEIWMLREEYPEKLPVWKIKHRQVFDFRSKLLNVLEKQLGRDWVQNLKEKADRDRIRVWPLQAGAGD